MNKIVRNKKFFKSQEERYSALCEHWNEKFRELKFKKKGRYSTNAREEKYLKNVKRAEGLVIFYRKLYALMNYVHGSNSKNSVILEMENWLNKLRYHNYNVYHCKHHWNKSIKTMIKDLIDE